MLTQTIYAHAREMPDKIAVAFDNGRLSYGDFAAAIETSRRSLIAEGILRLEGAVVLAAAAAAYAQLGSGWTWFALLSLVPDLSMLGYFAGPRIGAVTYNLAHSTMLPAALAACGIALSLPLPPALALIWIAHIGFDRMLGYGLKYGTAFGHTHLGAVGKLKARAWRDGDEGKGQGADKSTLTPFIR